MVEVNSSVLLASAASSSGMPLCSSFGMYMESKSGISIITAGTCKLRP